MSRKCFVAVTSMPAWALVGSKITLDTPPHSIYMCTLYSDTVIHSFIHLNSFQHAIHLHCRGSPAQSWMCSHLHCICIYIYIYIHIYIHMYIYIYIVTCDYVHCIYVLSTPCSHFVYTLFTVCLHIAYTCYFLFICIA